MQSSTTPASSRPRVELVVTDLDNTLYDWVTFFVESFYAMVDVASEALGVSVDELCDQLRTVHQSHHDSEHPFALLETKLVRARYPELTPRERKQRLDAAFHAFNSKRRATLRLYPGVQETLEHLRALGVPLVAHTEATVANALFRLRALGVETYFAALYGLTHSPSDHPEPERLDAYQKTTIRVRYLDQGERKPNPRVLLDICGSMQVPPERTLYVGDSISRDVGMAHAASVHSAWAKYGTKYDKSHWARLVRVTHWTQEDVERARLAQEEFGATQPEVILEHGFSEILGHFSFSDPVNSGGG